MKTRILSRAAFSTAVATIGFFLAAWATLASPLSAQEPAHSAEASWPVGIAPRGLDGRVLNLDFETGDLTDWTVRGQAFAANPVKGDAVQARRSDMASEHRGDYWVGSFEAGGDKPVGRLISAPFKIEHPWASFLVGGGKWKQTRVEIVSKQENTVIYKTSAVNNENMRPVIIDLGQYQGAEVFLRIIDNHSGGWGHINFDEFRFHDEKPVFPVAVQQPRSPAEVYEHAGLAPEMAAELMTVPDGFDVTLFAAEPDVKQPIALALDDRGRVWIAEAYSYPIRVPDEEAKDRILIFEDVDGDGKFDKRTVFAENLNLISGMEVGFGGVFVGAAPYLLFIPDKDGDDKPDGPPEILLDGWAYEDTHETLNAFNWGPDGWLYGCHGVFTHSRVGVPGTPDDERVPINAGVWRYHPTTHEFEVFAHGTSNPWGIDWDSRGQCFITACVIPHLFHMIDGGRYHRQAGQHFNPFTYDDIKTVAKHRHWVGNQWNDADRAKSHGVGGGHAHAGAMIYLGGLWPERYYDQIFMSNIHGARVNMDQLSRAGSGYVGDAAPDFLMANDSWSQILNFRYGPDGNVYFMDWYDRNQCHSREVDRHDRTNGRIFKITYTGGEQAEPWVTNEDFARELNKLAATKDLRDLSDEELLALHAHPNEYFTRHARRILQERGAKLNDLASALQPTETIVSDAHAEELRLRLLFTGYTTGSLSEADLVAALDSSESEYIRGWAIQFLTEGGEPSQQILDKFAQMARDDESQVVRLYLASALQDLSIAKRWPILEALVSHGEDATDHNLPLMYWYAFEPMCEADMQQALNLAGRSQIRQLLSFAVRRIAAIEKPEALAMLVKALGQAETAEGQQSLLSGINTALRGQRNVEMPAGFDEVFSKLINSDNSAIRSQITALAVTFGDDNALAMMRDVLADADANIDLRRQALQSLVAAKDAQTVAVLQALVSEPAMAGDAIRALGAFDDAKTSEIIIAQYEQLSPDAQRDAINTLASRVNTAKALLEAIGAETVPARHVTAEIVRQLRNLKNEEIDTLLAKNWGTVRETAADRAAAMNALIAELNHSAEARLEPDLSHGRAVFQKTCAQCHTLFDAGGKIGPELTGSNRADIVYLLSNVLDPSAVMAKEYAPSIVELADGRVLTGIVRQQENGAYLIQTANEEVLVPKEDVEFMEASDTSMMPDDLISQLQFEEVRALVAYLQNPKQVPMLASADNVAGFFNGQDLTGWKGNADLWSVENGEIVGRSSGLDRNEFLRSDLMAGDFDLTLEVKLTPNSGNSGIQFRSHEIENQLMSGYQADAGEGWWGKLYEEHGRALLWDKSGEEHVKQGEWNKYRIVAEGDHIRTWINGNLCVDLSDADGADRGVFAFQLHSGPAQEVRFRNIELKLLGEAAAEPVAGQ